MKRKFDFFKNYLPPPWREGGSKLEKNEKCLKSSEMMRKFQDFTFEKDSDTLPFSPYYDIFGGELYFSPRKSLPNFDCSP